MGSSLLRSRWGDERLNNRKNKKQKNILSVSIGRIYNLENLLNNENVYRTIEEDLKIYRLEYCGTNNYDNENNLINLCDNIKWDTIMG